MSNTQRISATKTQYVLKLIGQGMTQKAICKYMKLSATVVRKISNGTIGPNGTDNINHQHCTGCGHKVLMPCLKCDLARRKRSQELLNSVLYS